MQPLSVSLFVSTLSLVFMFSLTLMTVCNINHGAHLTGRSVGRGHSVQQTLAGG